MGGQLLCGGPPRATGWGAALRRGQGPAQPWGWGPSGYTLSVDAGGCEGWDLGEIATRTLPFSEAVGGGWEESVGFCEPFYNWSSFLRITGFPQFASCYPGGG